MTEVEIIEVTTPDGPRYMQIIVGAPVTAFSPDIALAVGFQPSVDESRWEGGITDEGVMMEMDRTGGLDRSMPWRRISEAEYRTARLALTEA
jgi:hypothetical protein